MNREYDYDEMPTGWIRAFGKMLLDDIYNQAEAEGLEDFQIMQIKEKWGSLRVYCMPTSEAIEDIIEAYSEISKHVCAVCGKLDVPTVDIGWIVPLCKDCFKYTTYAVFDGHEYEDSIVGDEFKILRRYRVFNPKTEQEEEIDISHYVAKVRNYADNVINRNRGV